MIPTLEIRSSWDDAAWIWRLAFIKHWAHLWTL